MKYWKITISTSDNNIYIEAEDRIKGAEKFVSENFRGNSVKVIFPYNKHNLFRVESIYGIVALGNIKEVSREEYIENLLL